MRKFHGTWNADRGDNGLDTVFETDRVMQIAVVPRTSQTTAQLYRRFLTLRRSMAPV